MRCRTGESDLGREKSIVRRLLYGQAITAFGDGLWFSLWAIFFTRIQGMSAQSMGLAMGVGGAVGLICATPLGVLADRYGPRRVLFFLTGVRTFIMIGFIWADDFVSLVAIAALFTAAQCSGVGVRITLTYGLVSEDRRLTVLAKARVVQHIAYAAGAGAAALVLALGTKEAFVSAILVNATTFVFTALLVLAVPEAPTVPRTASRISAMEAVRDAPFVALMASTAILAVCWAMLSSGLPIWVQGHTAAPQWTSAFAIFLSSALIALFQVQVTHRSEKISGAIRAARLSAVCLAGCCVLFMLGGLVSHTWLAFGILTLGLLAHVAGELQYMASRWGLSLPLMKRGAEGQYQGVVATTEAAVQELGPMIVISLIAAWQGAGWVVLGVILLASVAPTRWLTHRTLHSRQQHITGEPEMSAPDRQT